MSNKRFNNKVVLITGSTSGIGKTSALGFAKEGAKVIISGRRKQRGDEVVDEIKSQGGDAKFIQVDVAHPEQIKMLVNKTIEAYGRLDIAFNNAAKHDNGVALLADIKEKDFDDHMNVTLKSVWLSMKYEIKAMLAQGAGNYSIINSSSISGVGGGWPIISVYSTAKSGVNSMTKAAAQEYAQYGIRINSLGGGFFDTEMIHTYYEELANFYGISKSQLEAEIYKSIPLGRMATPDEVKNCVLFMSSDEASYITGNSFIIDGGMSAKYL
jgi:NAD(P)-dependent dehydrogenase (short-subunit alcohol dehydrogenase family)